jgi:endonuclease-3 related protein
VDPQRLHDVLLARYGRQGWWPAEDAFEVMAGAVLVQNTAWHNAARAVAALRAGDYLTPDRLVALRVGQLQRLIRPSGTYRVKARRLKNLARALRGIGGVAGLEGMTTTGARRFLLAVDGVGAETADAILVYALHRPAFVVDAYARRLWRRLTGGEVADSALRLGVEKALPTSAALGELHALVVAHGKQHCGQRPRCAGCVLRAHCVTGQASVDNRCFDR